MTSARSAWLLAVLLAATGGAAAADGAGDGPHLSPATTMDQAGLVDIRSYVPDIDEDMKYAGSDNFVGAPVDGYGAPRCFLGHEAAEALAKVEGALRERRMRLRLFDCYRPARAVAHFVRWAHDLSDQRTKAAHYPELDKSRLLDGYIAPVSGHSRGATVDLGLLRCNAEGTRCEALDMGTSFDYFGTLANTDSPDATPAQRANRDLLRAAMTAGGFSNYPLEWWHYTFQPEPTPGLIYDVPIMPTTQEQAIDTLMHRYDGQVPGASLLVLQDGEAVVRRGYGLSDLGESDGSGGVEAGPATDYRLASVSKQFTAAAILLLMQDGKLRLDDPLRRWLPSLPAATDGITLRHVLTHTSGLVDYEDLMAADYAGQIRDAGVLELLSKEDRLYFPPGSAYRYSNSGYALLSLVVEKASGMAYPDFLHRRIFEPLGMRDTLAYVQGGREPPHRAYGYSEVEGPAGKGHWQRTDQSSTSAVLGDGGIYSSIDDLASWDAALYDDRLLDDESRALAFSPQAKVTGEPYEAAYGFGWRITGETLWHSGETMGFRNVIVRWPQRHLTVVLLGNRNDPEPYRTALAIGALYMQR